MKQRMMATVGAVGAAVLVAGCGHTDGKAERAPGLSGHAVESKQVGLSAYESQGVKVKPSTNWYYGDTPGLRAHAVEGGILYVEEREGPEVEVGEPTIKGKDAPDADEHEHTAIGGCPTASPSDGKLRLRVHYRFASGEEVDPASRERLDTFLEGDPPAERLRVIGYTDDIGSDDSNVPLSGERAEFLAGRIEDAWPEVEVETAAGGSCPRLRDHDADLAPEEIRRANRRAEVYTLPAEEEDQ